MSSFTDDVHNEAERGLLVRILTDWLMEWMPFSELRLQAMRRVGRPVEEGRVKYHLNYLTQNGYAQVKQLRVGRAGMDLTLVRATPKAVDLVEGRLEPDAAIGL